MNGRSYSRVFNMFSILKVFLTMYHAPSLYALQLPSTNNYNIFTILSTGNGKTN